MLIYKEHYTGFVYIWYDPVRKMYYIGSHEGSVNDPYAGSSPRFINAYRKRKKLFRRRILCYHLGTRKRLYELEQYHLDMIKDEELEVRYYNFRKSAFGNDSESASKIFNAFYASETGEKRLQEMSDSWKTNNPCKPGNIPWNKGIAAPSISAALIDNDVVKWANDQERVENHSNKLKLAWEQGAFDGRPSPTKESRIQAAKTRRANPVGQSDYQKQRASETMKGVPKSEEMKIKSSESRKNTPQCSCIKCRKTMQRGRMIVHLRKCI